MWSLQGRGHCTAHWATPHSSPLGFHGASKFSRAQRRIFDVEEGCPASDGKEPRTTRWRNWATRLCALWIGRCKAFADASFSSEAVLQPESVESILKALDAKTGWIQEDESKVLLRKALFCSMERGKDESLRQHTTRRLAQIEAASAANSRHHANDQLGHSIVGRGTDVKTVGAESQLTPE